MIMAQHLAVVHMGLLKVKTVQSLSRVWKLNLLTVLELLTIPLLKNT